MTQSIYLFGRALKTKKHLFTSRFIPITLAGLGLLGFFQFAPVFGASDGIDEYSQCANDDGDGYTGSDVDCHWSNGNLNASNSTYHEDDATVQRLAIDDLPINSDHTVIIKYSTTKGGKHSYDFMTDDNFSELAPNPLTSSDLCDPALTNLGTQSDCASLTPDISGDIPADPLALGHDTARVGTRHFKIRNGSWVTSGVVSKGILAGPTMVSGSYASDSDTTITLKFHVGSSCLGQHSNKCEVLITWGAHISTQADWGTGNSAVNISGSPYHVQIAAVDSTSITGGGRDNQMAASAIVVTPTVTTTLHKADHSVVTIGGSVPLGTTMHDMIAVTGNTPTGSVVLKFYSNATCTGTPINTSGNINLSSGSVDATGFAQGPLAAGNYGFLAHYNGDQLNTAADGTCENFIVNKAQLTTNTQVHNASHSNVTNTSVPLGSVVHDTATLTGAVGGFSTPAVTFAFFTNGSCTPNGTSVANTGNDGGAVRSADSSALTPGSYSYKASVVGDTNYLGDDSDCEPFTVGKANLSLTTELHKANEDIVTVGSSVPLGTTMHDKGTVSGIVGSLAPANNVTFTFYDNNDCSGQGLASGSVALSGTVAHPSTAQGPLGAGDHSFQASIAGDTNYNGATSACEHFIVDKAQLTATTKVHDTNHVDKTNGSVPLGSVMHDTAKLSGAVDGFSTPAISFTLYANGACTGEGAGVSNTGADEGDATAVRSAASAALGAGSYSYKASVAGDNNYLADASDCEPFTVNKAQLGIGTELHKSDEGVVTVGNSVPLGTTMHDKATVSNILAGFAPTSNVSFTFYTNDTCTDGTSAGSVALTGNVAHPSDSKGPLGAGQYAFKANIAGDDNYLSATSECENFTVDKAQLTVTTAVHNSSHVDETGASVPLGSVMHDTATVTGGVSGFALPAVSFTLTGNYVATCDQGTAVANDGVEGSATKSADSAALTTGSYAYRGSVADNANYIGDNSDCEPFSVDRASTSVATAIHLGNDHATDVQGTTIALNSSIHDSSAVNGQVGAIVPTGTVSYAFYHTADCSDQAVVAGTALALGSESTTQSNLAPGHYGFVATYSGDDNYNGSTGVCETVTVDKASTLTTTAVHDANHADITDGSVALGSSVHDSATVADPVGGFPITGTLTYRFFANGSCEGNSADETVAVGSESTPTGSLGAGHYSYLTSYSGDDNYKASTGVCEPFQVSKAQLTVETTAHNAAHADITNTSVALGAVTHDTATVTGGVSGFTLPGVIFRMTTNYTDDCTQGSIVANNGSEGGATKSADSAALGAGSYAYMASVGSNANYEADSSACEPFTVSKGTPNIVTFIHNPNHDVVTTVNAGATVHDQAIVSGILGFVPGGTVDFTFYQNGTCDSTGAAAGTNIAVNGGIAHPSDSEGPLAGGSYSFKAHYDGDANYLVAEAECEPLTVNKLTPGLTTTPSPTSGTVGVMLNDSAALTGGFNPTGTITFKLFSPNDTTCSGTPAFTNVVTVNGAGTYNTSSGFASNVAGTWRWVAVYSGDVSNNSVSGGCNDEQVTIVAPVTRTLGFWQTHYAYTTSKFSASDPIWTICSPGRKVDSLASLFGGFYASIPKKSTGVKRSDLDQARMQLMQQLLAAILNHIAFGSGSTAMLDSAKAAYCGSDKAAILAAASTLDTFNNSGDAQPTSQNTGSADPKKSQATGTVALWDNLP